MNCATGVARKEFSVVVFPICVCRDFVAVSNEFIVKGFQVRPSCEQAECFRIKESVRVSKGLGFLERATVRDHNSYKYRLAMVVVRRCAAELVRNA